MEELVQLGRLTLSELRRVRRDISLIRDRAVVARIASKKNPVNKETRDAYTHHLSYEESPFIFEAVASYYMQLYSWIDLDLTEVPEVQYTRYEMGGKYIWHTDNIKSRGSKIRGLTMTINLSDETEYEGGELLVQRGKDTLKLDKSAGSFIIFPATLKHMACQVTSGVREALVIWMHFDEKEVTWIKKNAK